MFFVFEQQQSVPELSDWLDIKLPGSAAFQKLFALVLDYTIFYSVTPITVEGFEIVSVSDIDALPLQVVVDIQIRNDDADGSAMLDIQAVDAEVKHLRFSFLVLDDLFSSVKSSIFM